MTSERHPVRTYLVCGFLGAGKTTFVLEQLKAPDGRVAVLVNEFGKMGVDGESIRTVSGVEVVEMPGGCICCTQQVNMIDAIIEISSAYEPDLLLIEPSGVAEASGLVDALTDRVLDEVIDLEGVVTVVDASTFLEFYENFGDFFADQVAHADVILLNKVDLAKEDIDKVLTKIAELNPSGVVLKTEYCRFDLTELPGKEDRRVSQGKHIHLDLTACTLTPEGAFEKEAIERFLGEVNSGHHGKIFRLKGFVDVVGGGCARIQTTPGQIAVELFDGEPSPRIFLVGRDIQEENIRDFLYSLSREHATSNGACGR